MLELLFLGTGTSAGVPMIGCTCAVCRSEDARDQRTRPSVLVRYGSDQVTQRPGDQGTDRNSQLGRSAAGSLVHSFLIDTTPELRRQAIRHGLNRIDGVFYTHAHADHIFGLDDLRRFNAVMNVPIDIYGEQTVLDILHRTFFYVFDHGANINGTFVAHLIPHALTAGVHLDLLGARWTPIRLMHGRLPIVGFRVDYGGASIAYCTDVSAIPPESYALLAGLDVLVLDGLRHRHHPTHLTVEKAVEIMAELRPGRGYLTHIAHDIRHAELEPQLPKDVYLAYDGLSVVCEGAGNKEGAEVRGA